MKAKVYVTLKPGVLDPQGSAIHHVLESMGYAHVQEVRQGKYFEIALDENSNGTVREDLERIAREVLANPVIEDARVEIEADTTQGEGR